MQKPSCQFINVKPLLGLACCFSSHSDLEGWPLEGTVCSLQDIAQAMPCGFKLVIQPLPYDMNPSLMSCDSRRYKSLNFLLHKIKTCLLMTYFDVRHQGEQGSLHGHNPGLGHSHVFLCDLGEAYTLFCQI